LASVASLFRSYPFGFDLSSETPLFTLKIWWPFREGWSLPEEFMEEKQLYQSLKEWMGVGEAEVWATPVESQGWEWECIARSWTEEEHSCRSREWGTAGKRS